MHNKLYYIQTNNKTITLSLNNELAIPPKSILKTLKNDVYVDIEKIYIKFIREQGLKSSGQGTHF